MVSEQDNNVHKTSNSSRYITVTYIAVYLIFILCLPRLGVLKGLPQLVSYIILGAGGLVIFHKDFAEGFALFKNRFLNNGIWLIASLLGGILLQQLAAMPAYFLGSSDLGGNTDAILQISKAFPLPFIIVALGVLGPVTEEVIYRIILVGKASHKLPGVLCVILSSLAFMLPHVQEFDLFGFANVLPTFALGLSYAIVYYRTKNIMISTVLHVLNNTVALAFISG